MEEAIPQAGTTTLPATATPPAGTPPATPPSTGDTPPETDNSLEALQGKLAKSVNAEKNLRERLKAAEEAEKKWKDHEASQLSEAERLKQQLADMQTASAKAIAEANQLRAQVVAQANGFQPEAAALWLSSQSLTEHTDDAIKAALGNAPAWVKAQAQPGVTTQPGNPPRQAGELSHEQINQMTPQQYADYLEKKSRAA